jgi:hypothetical protein
MLYLTLLFFRSQALWFKTTHAESFIKNSSIVPSIYNTNPTGVLHNKKHTVSQAENTRTFVFGRYQIIKSNAIQMCVFMTTQFLSKANGLSALQQHSARLALD